MPAFSTIVIGKGLVGTAAAKYLAAAQTGVAVIGPDEPANFSTATVFASHYDQARVLRRIGRDAISTRLNADAAREYPAIQAETGIDFHGPVGSLYVIPDGMGEYLDSAPALSAQFGVPFTAYASGRALMDDFGAFRFPASAQGVFEPAPAGFINPRALIRAQLALFQRRGGTVLPETVVAVSHADGLFQVRTREGHQYAAPRVLVAAGSFVNLCGLVPRPLSLVSKSEVVLLARVSAAQAAALAGLPSLRYNIDDGETEGIYLIQPVRYPDGAWYLKMGCNMPEDVFFERLADAQAWFQTGDSDRFIPRLARALRALLPELVVEAYLTKRCVISRTAHGRPYIGETDRAGLFVAGGCNGNSAMSSDAIGSVAAHLMTQGGLPPSYAPDAFELVWS
ncbi:MAG: FAD-dependent oxidoreductase [Thermoflexales bacterium]|nr:FAD-dependent oxidoreductase [Thermoflexales bacterium]